MKPQGALNLLTGKLGGISQWKHLGELNAFVGSDEFLEMFGRVKPEDRAVVFLAYQATRLRCLMRAPVSRKRWRVNWQAPGAVERFIAVCRQLGNDRPAIARATGMTQASVTRAMYEHGVLVAGSESENAPKLTQEGPSSWTLRRAAPASRASGAHS